MPPPLSPSPDVVVIGGGVIGLSVAWRAAERGLRVSVLERGEPGGGTSRVAAGMIAPISEARQTERRLLELGLRSAHAYPAFVEDLVEASGEDPGYLQCGTIAVARDRDEAEALEREFSLRRDLGLPVRQLRASEARSLEPALAPVVRLGLEVPDDHAIDPRKLTGALARAVRHLGVDLRTGVEVVEMAVDGGQVQGVRLAGGEFVASERAILAAGVWSGSVGGLADEQYPPLRPVKGQILRLHDPGGPGLLTRALRMQGGYVVSRGDGRYVLGATMEERGFDTSVTAGPVFELLRDAIELLPGFSELIVDELSAGLRPSTPDNAPAIGPGASGGLYWATGHHRHGILLAPITAEIVVGWLAGEPPSDLAAPYSPERFAKQVLAR